jgi:hypothetical protein
VLSEIDAEGKLRPHCAEPDFHVHRHLAASARHP